MTQQSTQAPHGPSYSLQFDPDPAIAWNSMQSLFLPHPAPNKIIVVEDYSELVLDE